MSLTIGSFVKSGEGWIQITHLTLISTSLTNIVYAYDGIFISNEEKEELEK